MPPPTIIAARRFIDLLTQDGPPDPAMLARRIDELAMRYHDTPPGDPNESDEGLPACEHVDHADIHARFPELGHYGVTDPGMVPGDAYVADAIDDIMDIANDLKMVLWRFDRFGPDDAHWYFRMLYQTHWGRHLRNLASYLHSRLPEDDD